MSSIRFTCQCCGQPLRLNQSMETSGLGATQEPTAATLSSQQEPGGTPERGPTSEAETDSEKLQDGVSRSTLPSDNDGKMSRDDSGNFILLGEFATRSMFSNVQKTSGEIFDILTGERDVDHPLCEDCTDQLLEELDTQLILTEADNQNYTHWRTRRLREEELATLQGELEGLELQEARLVRELEEVDRNRERVAEDLEAARAETRMLAQQDERCWRDYSHLEWQQSELQDELASKRNQLAHAQRQWERLQKTDVFSATFEITHDGPVGIINSFRLGCLPTVPVSWNEINMAWGQTALLLHALSNKVGLRFQRYRLFPRGNRSYLKSLTDDTIELPLFCISGQSTYLDVKFDLAVMAFLDCMQQFKEKAEEEEWGLCLPCKIHVEDGLMEASGSTGELYSIRTRLNTEEQWTKALKLMLTNFKCTLAWISLKYCQK